MRIFAIAVNLGQIALILTVFLSKGMELGVTIIFVFFVLLLAVFVNLLVLLFYSASKPGGEPLIGKEAPLVKRQDLRVTYPKDTTVLLAVGVERYPVIDLAENGMRIHVARRQRLKKQVRGRITLLSRKTISVKASLVRSEGHEAALMFKQPIDYMTIIEEKQLVQNE